MMDQMYNFSDKQSLSSISGSGVELVSSNVNYNSASGEDAFDQSKALEIGGAFFNITVTTKTTGAAVTAALVTKAADASLSSGATTIATFTISASTSIGTVHSVQLPPGKTRLAYLGVLYTGAGNVTAGAVNAWLGLPPPIHDD